MKEKETASPARNGRKRILTLFVIITVCLTAVVLANMVMIYLFSEESVEDSGNRSTGVTAFVVKLLYPDFEQMSYNEKSELMSSTQHIIRKLAHFSEFALLGFLLTGLLLYLNHRFRKLKARLTWVIPIGFCLLYAISDEVHQIFSNRGPRVTDVMIDFAGALLGICIMHLIVGVVGCIRRKRREKACKTPATD